MQDLIRFVVGASTEFERECGRRPKLLLLGPAWARCLRRNGFNPGDVHFVDVLTAPAWFWGTVVGIPIYTLNDGVNDAPPE